MSAKYTLRQSRKKQIHRATGYRFFLTVSLLALLIATSVGLQWIKQHNVQTQQLTLVRRHTPSEIPNEECRSVHKARNQCAFIKHHCPDEEAGLLSYLQIYYCDFAHVKPIALTFIIIWCGLLFSTIGIAASDFFCVNLSVVSNVLGLSESLAGVTLLAFGNGSPDVFSTFAAINSHSGSLAIGELIGAAGFITSVVAGSMAIIRPFKVAKKSFIRDVAFFTIAVAFSMVFLANGSLELWECAVMVILYIFYVIMVVFWHWWIGRRLRKRQEAVAAADGYLDDINVSESADGYSATPSPNIPSINEPTFLGFADLERANLLEMDTADEDLEESERERFLGEINSNMRVTKAPTGERRTIFNPIRPSLVGALEFRAVLSAIERDEGSVGQTRRYSEAPISHEHYFSKDVDVVDVNDPRSRVLQNGIDRGRSTLEIRGSIAARGRAVSANDAAGLRIDPLVLRTDTIPSSLDLPGSQAPSRANSRPPLRSAVSQPDALKSSNIYVSTTTDQPSSRSRANTLEVPGADQTQQQQKQLQPRPPIHPHKSLSHQRRSSKSSEHLDYLSSGRPRARSRASTQLLLPHFKRPSPRHTPPASPFPPYRDDPLADVPEESIMLPSPTTEHSHGQPFHNDDEPKKLWRWWPYKYLVSPEIIGRTLFPTVCDWRDKNTWDKMLGIASAPSFFLLTITLPVVEPYEDDHNDNDTPTNMIALESATAREAAASTGITGPAAITNISPAPEWNRWLVILQLFTAPFFLVLIIWANTVDSPTSHPETLIKPTLISLAVSSCLLVLLLSTTTPTKPPRYHWILCLAGFIISITWISTIANEVVGVLKTIGVIFDISDAILGLTIFAVGNSLGDLVADITVARLGYPVMALSACFGGPLLNILLGIGLSGIFVIVQGAEKRVHGHPERPIRFRPYRVEVSTSLIVSAVALLVTLVGLLVAVPLNGWRMDRRIGVGLVVLWAVATAGNVVVEVLGWGEQKW